jgi:mannose-6-phosphate isomerase-like protein (cupin superfamily)
MLTIPKKWGYELIIENNDLYCGKHLHVAPYKQCSVHYHKIKKETFYIIEGTLLLEFSKSLSKNDWLENNNIQKIILKKGDSFTIEPLIAHRFLSANKSSCDFIEISTHHDDEDSYRLIESI